jgi:hypothetical protein
MVESTELMMVDWKVVSMVEMLVDLLGKVKAD